MRELETNARIEAGYYEMSEEDRKAWDNARSSENATVIAMQTDMWYEANIPGYGKNGSACTE